MRIHFMDLLSPIFGGLPCRRPIRRIKDGSRVDRVTENDLCDLPESTLRDIGFTSSPG